MSITEQTAQPTILRPPLSSSTTSAPAVKPVAGKIMIVDDEPINIKVARKYLSMAGYSEFVVASDATKALALIRTERPDVILLDVVMPQVSGIEILANIRADSTISYLPVLILTAAVDSATRRLALNAGATDFLSKPVDPDELIPRVRNALILKAHHDQMQQQAQKLEALVQERTKELVKAKLAVVHCLARAAEYRDNDTGRHVLRVGAYVGIIARQLGLTTAQVELLEMASPLHDIGKIGIPDSVLLKPGKLDADEFSIMQKHCAMGRQVFDVVSGGDREIWKQHVELGAKIIGENNESNLLNMAATIALTHHERWDGSGYPLGLAGEDIPLEGRITAVADVFDALSSKRPYKPPFPCDKCFTILEEGRGTHFDPKILDAFFARKKDVVEVQIRYAD